MACSINASSNSQSTPVLKNEQKNTKQISETLLYKDVV